MYRISSTQWWTRYWQLGRKIENHQGVPTANHVRMAAILRQAAATMAHAGPGSKIYEAAETMEWVIDYGTSEFEARLRAAKAEAGLGTER
jgi:hypothetical protein